MYKARAGVWVGTDVQSLWQRLYGEGRFVDLLPQVSFAQKLTAHSWHWELGKDAGGCIVVCETLPCSRLSWRSVEGLPTSGQVRLERKAGRMFLEVELQTFPVWSLGELLSRTDSPAIVLRRRLHQFAERYSGDTQAAAPSVLPVHQMRADKSLSTL